MKRLFLIVFVLAGLVPFVSPARGASMNDAYDRYLEKRDMNFGQRREPEEKAEEKAEVKTQEAEEPDQSVEVDEDAFETLYKARQEAA